MTRPTYTADKELSNGFRERDREQALGRQRSIPGRIYYTLLTLAALAGVGSLLRSESWAVARLSQALSVGEPRRVVAVRRCDRRIHHAGRARL